MGPLRSKHMKDSGAIARGLRNRAKVGVSVVDFISVRSVVGEESVLFVSVRVFVVTLCRDPGVWREETRIALLWREHMDRRTRTQNEMVVWAA